MPLYVLLTESYEAILTNVYYVQAVESDSEKSICTITTLRGQIVSDLIMALPNKPLAESHMYSVHDHI